METVRVAQIIGKLNAAGVEAVINNYYRNIDREKYQFDYYVEEGGACQPPQELIDLGARYFIIPPSSHPLKQIRTLTRHFRENEYIIVHTNLNTLAPISMYSAWKAHVPVRINHNHTNAGRGETVRNIIKYMLRPFAKCFANAYASCSMYSAKWLFGSKMVEKGKVRLIRNAVETERFLFNRETRDRVRKEMGFEGHFVVGHVGRIYTTKNQIFLVEAFKFVHDKNPKALLLLVGVGKPEYEEELKRKVKELGLEDSVILTGARTDVNELYQAMDVFVLPSLYEGLPVVAVEAQTSGLPCVFSNRITEEVILCDGVQMLSIDGTQELWAEKILASEGFVRKNRFEEIRKSGYDIKEESLKLEAFYNSLITAHTI